MIADAEEKGLITPGKVKKKKRIVTILRMRRWNVMN